MPDPIALYGLPMALIEDMGDVLVLRAQRGIIQKWLVHTPWARAGQVTIANSGDLAKEAGLLPTGALDPILPPEPPADTPSPVDLSFSVDRVVTSGEPVALSLRVTNPSSETVEWETGLPIADFEVLRDGVVVWRWSAGQAFPRILLQARLGPGETQTYQEAWPVADNDGQPVSPGEYQAVGILTSSPAAEDITRPVPVRTAPVTITVR